MKLYRLRANYKNKGSKGYNPFDYDGFMDFWLELITKMKREE